MCPDKIINEYAAIDFGDLCVTGDEKIAYQKDMSKTVPYDEDYFNKYISYEDTQISNKINTARIGLVLKHNTGTVLDIGIGSGEFLKKADPFGIKGFGYDVNPYGVKWLKDNYRFIDPYENLPKFVTGVTFWDSLEHIKNPYELISKIQKDTIVYISIPSFSQIWSVKKSKHYRPDEHYYYFTPDGIIDYMRYCDFSFIEMNDMETTAGREDIKTFVFRKNKNV